MYVMYVMYVNATKRRCTQSMYPKFDRYCRCCASKIGQRTAFNETSRTIRL